MEDTGSIAADWIDLMDAFLAEEEDGTTPAPEADEPSLRQLLGDEEEYLSDAEAVTEQDVSAETADILNFANELIEHEAPAPVVAPEPIDVPIPEPIPIELPEEEQPEKEELPDLSIEDEPEEEPVEGSVDSFPVFPRSSPSPHCGKSSWAPSPHWPSQPVLASASGTTTRTSTCSPSTV